MIVFSCNNVNVSFGQDTILENINININEKDKIGIVGANGAGKTTFIKLILGEIEAEKGTVIKASKIQTGYLSQYSGLSSESTLIEEFMEPFSHLIDLEQKINDAENRLQHEDSDKIKLSGNLVKMYEEYTLKGGNEYKNRVRSILIGLGFEEDKWNTHINTLSGGQKTRLALGRLLVNAPPVLILDEPTNHLDIQSIEWLEEHLKNYQGTLICISHDRFFLDMVTDKTLLIENKDIMLYNAPYSKYIVLRENDKTYQEKCYNIQQREIAKIEAFIEKQRQWNRERNIIAAESRLKKLDKMTIIEKPKEGEKPPAIKFEIDNPCGNEVLFADNLSYSFTDKPLFKDLSFKIYKGDRVFIKGPNGCGKSTLLKIITGYLNDYQGSFKIGHGIKPGYYTQDLSDLNEDNIVFDEIYDCANELNPSVIRNALAAFGFTGDDVFKKISVLSGGEKARISLLKITYEKSPFLILDEPTNHLDIKTREVLESALCEYKGTILAVSHDRYFVNKLATKFIDMTPEVKYEDNNKVKIGKQEYLETKEERARIRKTELLIQKLENEIADTENRIKEIEILMSNNSDYNDLQNLYTEYEDLKKHLSCITDSYLELTT